MAAIAVSTIAFIPLASTSSGAASDRSTVGFGRAQDVTLRVSAPDRCPSARAGLRWYRQRHRDWLKLRGAEAHRPVRAPRNCTDARWLATQWRSRSYRQRQITQTWLEAHTLDDFTVRDGNAAWRKAVREAQRAYPGTEDWLLSCSASEGGWGRWVSNSQGSGVGGWMQFYPGTFYGFFRHAESDVRARRFRVPRSASSWYSPLGQALAGAWAITHGMRHHWVGHGC